MANSHPENKEWIANVITQLPIKTVLDCGAGDGGYERLLRAYKPEVERLDAVEVWEANIEKHELRSRYDNVYHDDIRKHLDYAYDLVIFGDVLEHMTRREAIDTWEWARSQAKYVLLSLPIIPFPQDGIEDNPYEVHVTPDWSHEQVMLSFSGIVHYRTFTVVGAYFAFGGDLEAYIFKMIKDQIVNTILDKKPVAKKRTQRKK